MDAISPVMPVVAVEGISQQASRVTPEMQALADRFNGLMEHEPAALDFNRARNNDHSTVASEFLARQDMALRQTLNGIQRLGAEAPTLSVPELIGRHMDMTYRMVTVQMQFNSEAHVAHSAKSGLQTLMKNQ
jgi:type III secretion system HrpB2-like protein